MQLCNDGSNVAMSIAEKTTAKAAARGHHRLGERPRLLLISRSSSVSRFTPLASHDILMTAMGRLLPWQDWVESGHCIGLVCPMTEKHFYMPTDFARACQQLEEAGFTVDEARYYGRHFGNWSIEVSGESLKPRLIAWDGRDRWIILQVQGSGDEWTDEWVVREPHPDTIEQIIVRLRQ